ncbi:hypothetical protein QWY28_00640 [Nocardioides sp. SOB77]|uniref:DUF4386 family protein n=1 Tax=Nocardioides oceani TaxID=3058369 RepID=A0ABT8F9X0_9ACTN|nr:hypothetical protein [Nocardioides oceani]MDN4171441.1 hypothetical protein [Nocardioides oceani]
MDTTTTTTTRPARTDLRNADRPSSTTHAGTAHDGTAHDGTARPSRHWALAGIGAGATGVAAIVASGLVDAVYDPRIQGDAAAIADKLATQREAAFVFHTVALLSAVLLVVFAAGLLRRLRHRVGGDSLLPIVAFAGLAGTAVVQVIGTSLDTEFLFGLPQQDVLVDSNVVMYGHFIGTVPWCWVLAGLAGLALHLAGRAGAVPRWVGRVGLVLGGLTLLAGISPLQYLAGMVGPLWLLVTALGFALGDKAYRSA